MLHRSSLFLLVLLALVVTGCQGDPPTAARSTQPSSAAASELPPLRRVVGYLPLYRDPSVMVPRLDLRTLTHLNIAFVNPDDAGSFATFEAAPAWIALAERLPAIRAAGVKVLASIGGGAASESLRGHLQDAGRRTAYVTALLGFADRWRLDGIDVDLEGSLVRDGERFNPFVLALGEALRQRGLLMTAAFSLHSAAVPSDAVLARLDFINAMAYDQTGSWAPTRVMQHSSWDYAQASLDAWTVKRGIAPERVVLGVPFYGWRFFRDAAGKPAGDARAWAQIVDERPQATAEDSYGDAATAAGAVFYNGTTTIAAKTRLARRYGGIMVWELGQDRPDDRSLFAVIRANAR